MCVCSLVTCRSGKGRSLCDRACVLWLLVDLKREDPYGNGDSDGETESLEAPIPKTQLIHRMQLFRTKILHFVNSLHSYLMTRVSKATL